MNTLDSFLTAVTEYLTKASKDRRIYFESYSKGTVCHGKEGMG